MRFVSYSTQKDLSVKPGLEVSGGVVSIAGLLGRPVTSMNDMLQTLTEAELAVLQDYSATLGADDNLIPLHEIRLHAPIQRLVHDMLCVGVNYKSHLEETQKAFTDKLAAPQETVFFTKRALIVSGPDADIEGHFTLDWRIDYEVELAVVIGKTGRNIPNEQAEQHIFGYTIVNDISARGIQGKHGQWFRGKSLDTYATMGPAIVHKSLLPLPFSLGIQSRVNGELRQNAHTGDLVANIPTLIEQLSSGMTLEPGDIIATGTPAGVGMGYTPPRYLKAGDIVECEIEQIGILRNRMK